MHSPSFILSRGRWHSPYPLLPVPLPSLTLKGLLLHEEPLSLFLSMLENPDLFGSIYAFLSILVILSLDSMALCLLGLRLANIGSSLCPQDIAYPQCKLQNKSSATFIPLP